MIRIVRSGVCFFLLAGAGVLAVAGAEAKRPSVFDLPVLESTQAAMNRTVTVLFANGRYAEAEKLLQAGVERVPHDANAHYNLACALARQGKNGEALTHLERAVALGFRDPKHIEEDDDLEGLREDARFEPILKKAAEPMTLPPESWKYEVRPAAVEDGKVLVTEENSGWIPQLRSYRVFFKLDNQASAGKPIAVGLGKVGDLLRRWDKEGTAAGNHGDLYDNHDGGHSNMELAAFPRFTRIEFSEAAKKRGLHQGLQRSFRYNGVTIGNSSTALTAGPIWRCQGRLALTQPQTALLISLQYIGNHLYVYPEHRDHDPGHNGADGKGYGDVFPANTPYMIISQGSSGSDRVFLNAVAATLAAFRPEVKQQLVKTGMLMPTVQLIFRSSNKMVRKPEDYLTGKAHPTVFDGGQLDVEKMVTMAHDMTPDALPPIVQFKDIKEDRSVLGRDYFDLGPRERLFDTPCAIARVVKSTKYLRRMVISAEASKDLHGKPLEYHWVVLRGDADRIQINKLDEAGARAELLVPYHERRPVAPGAKLESNRVDIGVFVHNGDYYSAPAFVCFLYLDNEKRVYDDRQRIEVVDYTDPAVRGNYVDPLLDLPKDWRDEYRYGEDGQLLGWTRIRGPKHEDFTAEGLLVLEKDDQGRPVKTSKVRYLPERRPKGTAVLKQQTEPGPAE